MLLSVPVEGNANRCSYSVQIIARISQTKSSLALQLCKSVLPSIEKIILEFIPHCHKSGKILPLKFFLKFAQS